MGVTGGACGRSMVTVASSSATLGVSITDNTKSWSCTNLTVSAAGTLNFNFGAVVPSATVSPLVVSSAAAFTATPVVILRGAAVASLAVGSYPLVTWGSVSGTTRTSVVLPPHMAGNLSVTGNRLFLNVTTAATLPLKWAIGSDTWNINGATNWVDNASVPTAYQETASGGDSVMFEDGASGAGPITVTLATNVAPIGVTFSNSAKSYTVSGSGAITGSIGATKDGSGAFVLANTNTYSGSTVVRAGTLQLGDGTAQNGVVAGGIVVSNGAALTFANPNAQTYAGVISGSGTMTKSGPGTLTLTGLSAYTNSTTINSGVLALQNTTTFVSRITNNAALVLNRTVNGFASRSKITGLITGSGTINVNNATPGIGGGWVTLNSANSGLTNFNGTINVNSGVLAMDNIAGTWLGSKPTMNVAAGGLFAIRAQSICTLDALTGDGDVLNSYNGNAPQTLTVGANNGSGTFAGLLHGSVASGGTDGTLEQGILNLNKAGSGTQTLSGTNTYAGWTTISAGTLTIGGAGQLGSGTYAANITNNATFVFNSSAAQTFIGNVAGTGTLVQQGAGTLQIGDGVTDKTLTGSTISNNTTVVFNVASAKTYAGTFTGSGLFSKQGGGTFTLTGTNKTFTAPVEVVSGSLVCVTSNQLAAVVVDPSAAFGVKRLTTTGSATATTANLNSPTMNFDLNQNSLNSTPLFIVSGALTNTGTMTVTCQNLNPAALTVGTYPLIQYGSFVDGGFSSFNLMPISSQVTAYVTNETVLKKILLVVTAADSPSWAASP